MTASNRTYERAAAATGKTVEQLRAMAIEVFASMLFHVLDTPGIPIWTAAVCGAGGFNVEVAARFDRDGALVAILRERAAERQTLYKHLSGLDETALRRMQEIEDEVFRLISQGRAT